MYIEGVRSTNCCGMVELYGFYSVYSYREKSWWEALLKVMEDDGFDAALPAIFLFSGSSDQREDEINSPFVFAKWLESQGQSVVNTKSVLNSNSGNHIQAFLWTPTRKFRTTYKEIYNKKNESTDSSGDGSL